ncbi:ornithine cyclodeaminase family protein [Radicibacter daui]|uniref:ornithine cyclodeaminase family protein n=1 Tax=Radicibacter daui TaxID=3064829 RepID=UPI004046F5E5
MRHVLPAELDDALDYPGLVEALREIFRTGGEAPQRLHYPLPATDNAGKEGTLLLMPAWLAGRFIGIKLVTVFPQNGQLSLPSVQGSYLLLDGSTGVPLAMMDGPRLTVRRTAAASALASTYLSRPDAATLLVAGTGALAPHLLRAHATVRPIRRILVWGRSLASATGIARQAAADTGLAVEAVSDLATAASEADIISCATLATSPLIKGEWLRAGTHLDLVGGFRPDMREADDECVRRATLFADTRSGALHEAGDLAQPLQAGLIGESDIAADLYDLTRGNHPGRRSDTEITLFKSVGHALEDLAAAILCARQLGITSP